MRRTKAISGTKKREQSTQPSRDILSEREVILRRILELKAELDKQEADLRAIDILLASNAVASPDGTSNKAG